jgi:hypothetical protein
MPAPSKYREIELRYGKPMKTILEEAFARLKTEKAVGDELGVGQPTINAWLIKLNLRKQVILVAEAQASLCQEQAS